MNIPEESSHSITTTSSLTNGTQGVDVSTLVMNSLSDGLIKTRTTKEELIAQRNSKRAANKAEIHAKAEGYKRKVPNSLRDLVDLLTIPI
jgi:hypothetical protein